MKKRIKIPIYEGSITVVVNPTIEEGYKEINVTTERDSLDRIHAMCIVFGGREFAMILTPKTTVGEIAHECLHCVNRTLMDIGYSVDPDNDETQAYFLNWMVDEVYKIWKLSLIEKE